MARKSRIGKASGAARTAAGKLPGISTNPMTNLVIADVALRGGGRLLRHAIERVVLGAKYSPDKAKDIVKGRSMGQTLLGTAIARVATRSIPGAILVGGGLLAKTLYDRSRSPAEEKTKGKRQIERLAKAGRKSDEPG